MALASDLRSQHPGVLLLRYTTSVLMLFHGVAKLSHGVGPIGGMLEKVGLPSWLAFGVFIGEVVAPLLVMAGLWTRWAALVMAATMVVAVWLAHPDDLLALSQTGGYRLELQAFFFFNALVIAWLAGGRNGRSRSR